MSKDVSVEFLADGEVRITKHRDTEEARETVEAIKWAVEFFNKNSDEDRPEAFDPDAGEDDNEHTDDVDTLSPRERRRRDQKLIENSRESRRVESTAKRYPMIDPDVVIAKVSEAGCGFALVKRFAESGSDELTEHQVTALLLGAWGVEFGKRFQSQTEEGRIARAAVMKARDAAFTPTVLAIGERALAVTSGARGEKADPLRERIIRDKAVGSPFLNQEQLAAYADQMIQHLEGLVRGKQERSRPGGGTLERV
jgi:hypothetical protein